MEANLRNIQLPLRQNEQIPIIAVPPVIFPPPNNPQDQDQWVPNKKFTILFFALICIIFVFFLVFCISLSVQLNNQKYENDLKLSNLEEINSSLKLKITNQEVSQVAMMENMGNIASIPIGTIIFHGTIDGNLTTKNSQLVPSL